MSARLKLFLRIALSLVVSGVFVAFSLRHTDVAAVTRALRGADPGRVLGYLAILMLVHIVKTLRWGLLLRPLGAVSLKRLNAASAVGFMLMVLLPLRLGELARPLLVARPSPGDDSRFSRSGAMATAVVERVADMLAVGVLGVVSLHAIAAASGEARLAWQAAVVVTVGFGALCALLAVAYFKRAKFVAITRLVLQKVSASLATRAAMLLERFIGGLHFGSAGNALSFLAMTVFYWGLHVLGFWLVAHAFQLWITPMAAATVLAFQVVGIMIPAGPGMIGTSQFFTQLGLSLFVAGATTDQDVAARVAGTGNMIWILQFGQQVLTGAFFLVLGHVTLGGLFDPWEGDPLGAEAASEGGR